MYYKWKSKHGGMEASDIRRLRDLEAENALLKRMVAYLSLENETLKDVTSSFNHSRKTILCSIHDFTRHSSHCKSPIVSSIQTTSESDYLADIIFNYMNILFQNISDFLIF
ncbi:Transposase [Halodesulfovibrio aestuarii]|uniref:Transposase n=1 Tax=Halodesulfovibrio aestuarii TaxID=126333 RepID=A0A8G2C901_9BACT|nr:Transposase [Halodesulfovibrio aestuarii]